MRNIIKMKIFKVALVLFPIILLTGCTGASDGPEPISKGNWFLFLPYKLVEFFIHTFQGNFALAIIISTIIIRTALWPIYAKSNAMSKNMQTMQPELQKINEKYAGRTDSEAARQKQAEIMALYRQHGVNPLGCFLPLLQMPVFWAMYQVVTRIPTTFEARGKGADIWSDFLWGAFDLSERDSTFILPILVALTMILQQWIMFHTNKKGKTGGNQQNQQMQSMMKMMMIIFPVLMFIFAFQSPAALSLYWIVGTLYSTAQMIISKKPWKKEEEKNEVIDLTKKQKKSYKN